MGPGIRNHLRQSPAPRAVGLLPPARPRPISGRLHLQTKGENVKTALQHIADAKHAAKQPAYIRAHDGGLYTAFVNGRGFRANVSLASALDFIRAETGLASGAVPCFDETTKEWASELDLAAN